MRDPPVSARFTITMTKWWWWLERPLYHSDRVQRAIRAGKELTRTCADHCPGDISEKALIDQLERKACSSSRIYSSRRTDRDIYLERKKTGRTAYRRRAGSGELRFQTHRLFLRAQYRRNGILHGMMEVWKNASMTSKKDKILKMGKDIKPRKLEKILALKRASRRSWSRRQTTDLHYRHHFPRGYGIPRLTSPTASSRTIKTPGAARRFHRAGHYACGTASSRSSPASSRRRSSSFRPPPDPLSGLLRHRHVAQMSSWLSALW